MAALLTRIEASDEDRQQGNALRAAWLGSQAGGSVMSSVAFQWPGTSLASEPVDLSSRLYVLSRAGGELAGIDIRFSRRIRFAEVAELTGTDAAGLIDVQLIARIDNSRHTLNIRSGPLAGVKPADLLPVVHFLDALQPGRELGFSVEGLDAGRVVVSSPAVDVVPPNLVTVVELVARVQSTLGVEFPMPETLEDEELQDLLRIDRLLRGETVHGTWTEGSITVDRAGFADEGIQLSAEPVMIEMVSEIVWSFRGTELSLGEVRQVLRSAQVANLEQVRKELGDPHLSEVMINFEPGPSNEAEQSLVAPRRWSPYDRDGRVIEFPPEALARLRRTRRSSA